MNRLKSGLATGGLMALALAVSPAIPAGAATSATASTAGTAAAAPAAGNEATLKAAEQAKAPATASALGLGSDEKLTVRSVVTDADGATHVRYERTLGGLRVIGGDLVAHRDTSGTLTGTTYNLRKAVRPASLTPRIDRSRAEATAAATSRAAGKRTGAGELVVFQGATGPRLAYDVVTTGVQADQTPSRLHTVVDATTGATLTSFDEIKHGTGQGIFVGTVSLGTTSSGGSHQLRDSIGNYTTDLNGATSGTGTTFTDADDQWGNGSVSSRQSAAVDAHYGAEKTYDYYNTQLGRAGIWNNGTGARSRVHYGSNYSNAFWDGTQMTYGDGASNTHPLVELDVAGHEMSHGVTENTANLTYSGESGGLNEATSDIFGTAVEWYANNPSDTPDYLIGEEVNLNGNGTPLRYMDKPSKDGASKDCWSSSLKGLDPHYSSGPLNHWYYLLSEGSGAKTINGVSYNSPTCNGGTVTGISHQKAEKIWYRTLSTYLTSSSTYSNARTGAVRAAKDLYGAGSAECSSVEAAFSAISVVATSETCGGGTTPPPTTGTGVTNGGFESGQTGWTGSSGPITNDSGRPAHGGSWKMWLGGNGTTASENEAQTIAVPSSATSPTLTYWVRVDTAETTTSTAYDKATVSVGGTAVKSYSNLSSPKATWSQVTVDLSAWKGQSVSLKFAATEDSSAQTSFVFDDVATSF
ncbi:Zn-dependent metalloprotease [Terracoccus luteus]|uniref:Neutral metalloproteinase n=1 Tax=Terracoccus luteus TaxID=53356 RepID=A0A495Y345_9MICO|nr:M4 family metallopeptidase [Terracoccus luteus]RKT79824.1 Zn-dependent metalloprotease [Terracoccus luteus]